MKIRNLILGLALALALFLPAVSQAQPIFIPAGAYGVSDSISAVDTDVAVYVKYIGTTNGVATVTIAGGNSAAFTAGGAADTTINPVTGGVGSCGNVAGTMDLTQAACNTVGEFIDQVNSSPNWLAWPGAALRSDVLNGRVLNAGPLDGQPGAILNWDTSAALEISLDVRPGNQYGSGRNMDFAISGTTGDPNARINVNPFRGFQMLITAERENITSAGVIANFVTYGLTQEFNPKRIRAAGAGAAPISYSEVVRTIWSQAGAATTVEGTNYYPLLTAPGERVMVRITTTVGLTVPRLNVTGLIYKSSQQ